MPYPCFKCDVELVAGARFCHQCGAPNLLTQPNRRAREVPMEEDERYRIKRDIQEAAAVPTGTRMIQTVLPPPPPRPRTPIKPKGVGERIMATRFWARWWLWATVCGIVFLAATANIIVDLKERLQGGGELNQVLTRLASRCPRDTKPQLMEYIGKIHKTLTNQRSLSDAAELLDIVVHDVPTTGGSCAKLAEALTKPDRFAPLAQ